jgi:hypothetical protein
LSSATEDPKHIAAAHGEPGPSIPAAAHERAERLTAVGCEPHFYKSKHGIVSVMDASQIGRRSITDKLESGDTLVRLLGEIEARGYIFEGFTPEAAVLRLIDQLIDRVIELEAPLIARGSPRKLALVRP